MTVIDTLFDKGEKDDYAFRITPVLTYSWGNYKGQKGYAIALEWGFWVLLIAYVKNK